MLGVSAWLTVLVCYPASGELRLSRQLGSGALIARVPEPQPWLFGRIVFGPPQLSARYFLSETGSSAAVPFGTLWADRSKNGEQVWFVRLDPRDKSWDLEVTEKRTVSLRFGGKRWRVGTKAKVWRTDRTVPENGL